MFRQCFLQSYREASFKQLRKEQFAKFRLPLINETQVFGAERARLEEWKKEEEQYEIPAYLDRIK